MDDTRDRGPGAALLEPEDEPDATHTTPDSRSGGQHTRPTPLLMVVNERHTDGGVNAAEPVHGQNRPPALQGREVLRRLRAVARRASARLTQGTRTLPGAARGAAPRAWGWARAHATPGRLIGLLACALSIGFYAWYAGRGLTLAYGDAISHMLIARRVLMSRTPGLAQFGTVWPPFMHILMLPFVWNETLFRSGLAGALPSMAAYVIAAVAMYRLGALAFSSRVAGVVAALTLMLNPDALYMQGTPMTEMGLICCAVVALYYVLRWVREQRPLDLVKSALAVAAGSLIRYDGWALAAALLLVVGYAAWRARGRWYAEASVVIFAMLAFAGSAAWIIYNQVIFGDALAFLRGPYSSEAMQQIVAQGSPLSTKGNLWHSFLVYSVASLDSVGWVIAGLALAGALVWCYRERLRPSALPLYLVWVPFVFNWYSLFNGTSTLDTVEFPVAGMRTYFNERYGMMMIPAAALFIGYLAVVLSRLSESREVARMSRWLSVRAGRIPTRFSTARASQTARMAWHRYHAALALVPLTIVAIASLGITFGGTPYALEDPLHGANAIGFARATQESDWLKAHVHGQQVLISYGSLAPVIFLSGFPDRTLVTDTDGQIFQAALAHPERTIGWIVMDAASPEYDPVWQALHDRQDWRQFYILRAVIGSTQIYERIGTSGMT